jgi:hypothetical protein
MGRNTAASPRTPAPVNGPAIFMARLVEVAGAPVVVTAPAVAVVLLMVLTAVLEVSVPVVVVLLKPPAVTVDSLASVSERQRIAERAARTYLVASLDVVVSVVVAGAWTPFRMSLGYGEKRTGAAVVALPADVPPGAA